MGAPPTKRQKRAVSLSSDDDDVGQQNRQRGSIKAPANGSRAGVNSVRNHLPTRSRAAARSSTTKAASTTSRSITPHSSPKKSGNATAKTNRAGTLLTFFNSTTLSQQVANQTETFSSKEVSDGDDFIQDDSLDEELTKIVLPIRNELALPNVNQRSFKASASKKSVMGIRPNSSQKFLKNAKTELTPTELISGDTSEKDLRTWAERFSPISVEELAVHKRKILDVQNWLDNVLNRRNNKMLLILKGPSGTGKTATLSALATAMNFEITEWKNPSSLEFASENFQSLTAYFKDFLGRSSKYSSLTLKGTKFQNGLARPDTSLSKRSSAERRVILLEEFPNTFSRTANALSSFRANVLQYLAAKTPSLSVPFKQSCELLAEITPLIMIISETLLSSKTMASDTFTAHRLLGPEILNHSGTTVIEFNPIAPTFLTKALDLVIEKEARHSGRRRIPGPTVLKRLGDAGDIRSAIGSLEFLCIRGDSSSDWSSTVAGRNKKGGKAIPALTKMEQESIELVTQREASLGIFHAVGKVVYNKRGDSRASLPTQPPDHLRHHTRPCVSEVSIEDLLNETGTDTPTFIAALHENYLLSCNGPACLEHINGCIDTLSDSDILSSDRPSGLSVRRGLSCGSDSENLRQDELCFQIAVRGLLFALPYPVKRHAIPTASNSSGGRVDAFKMFYPTSMRLWKQVEEIEGLVDGWMDIACHNSPYTSHPSSSALHSDKVESWRYRSSTPSSTTITDFPQPCTTAPIPLLCSSSDRTANVLERLPYLARISLSQHTPAQRRELETITQFHGVGAPSANLPDEDAAAAADDDDDDDSAFKHLGAYHRGQHIEDIIPVHESSRDASGLLAEGYVERTVLSDDDIEDD